MCFAKARLWVDLWTLCDQVKAKQLSGHCCSEATSCDTKSAVEFCSNFECVPHDRLLPPPPHPACLQHTHEGIKMLLAMAGVMKLLSLLLVTILLGHFTAVSAICAVGDRNALLQFKSELQDPYGVLSDWDTNPDCCTWLQTHQYRMTSCNSAGRVTSLTMGPALEYKPGPVYTKVSGGEYGVSLSKLTYLEKLDLQTIYSGGARISSTWAALTRLSNVTLEVLVAGPLPPQVVKSWPLKYLALTNNDLNGTLPVELCKRTLKTLNVSGNGFTGPIPSCLSRFPASSFNDSSTGPSGNEGLCGAPLPPCS